MKALIASSVLVLVAACGGDDAAGTAGMTGATGAAATGGFLASGGTGAVVIGGVGASGTGTGGAPTGGTSGGTSTGGVGGVASGDGGMPIGDAGMASCSFTADAMPAGACENATDCMLIESGDVDRESDRCGRMCILNGAECTVMCMTDAIDVSAECARCFADIVQCSSLNCALMCFADSAGMPCRDCVDTMCGPAFDACTGRRGP